MSKKLAVSINYSIIMLLMYSDNSYTLYRVSVRYMIAVIGTVIAMLKVAGVVHGSLHNFAANDTSCSCIK